MPPSRNIIPFGHISSLLMLLALLVGGCSAPGHAPKAEQSRDITPGAERLVRLADAEIRGLDPQKNSDLASLRVAADQFSGLTRFDGEGKVRPALAASWSVSDDGLRWRFALRKGLRFSDGTAMDAGLFPALWQRLHDPATASPHTPLFASIRRISAPDPGHVVVELARPMPELAALLAHPALAALPLHIISRRGDGWSAMRPIVASGPYRLVRWRLNDHILLERNPRWSGAPPAIAQIVWKPVDDPLAAMRLFLAGEADISSAYPQSRHDWLKQRLGEQVHNGPYPGCYYFVFNLRQPPFDDVRIRRALSMAVDRDWMARKLLPMGNRAAFSLVPPELMDGQTSKPGWAALSLAQRRKLARTLLARAGYGPDNPLRFEIRINSSAEHRRMAVAMAAMWRELGVEASILNSEASLHFAALRRGEFQLARSGWIADLPAAENFLAVHRADAGAANYSGFASPAYDKALDEALMEADSERRIEKLHRAETILLEAAPFIPLWFYQSGNLVSSRIGGWHDNADNVHSSESLSLIAAQNGKP